MICSRANFTFAIFYFYLKTSGNEREGPGNRIRIHTFLPSEFPIERDVRTKCQVDNVDVKLARCIIHTFTQWLLCVPLTAAQFFFMLQPAQTAPRHPFFWVVTQRMYRESHRGKTDIPATPLRKPKHSQTAVIPLYRIKHLNFVMRDRDRERDFIVRQERNG